MSALGVNRQRVPPTRLQSRRVTAAAHRILASQSDTTLVVGLRRIAEAVVELLHSENHDPRTNGEFRLIRRMAPWLRTAVDVGANRGVWTSAVLTARPNARVLCAELATPTRDKLAATFAGEPRVTILDCGLADRRGAIPVKHYPADDRLTSFVDYPHPQPSVVLHEQVRRGDDVLAELHLDHVDLMKIDAEGGDLAVLHGFENTLSRGSIDAVQFEYGFACVLARVVLLDFYELLGDYGYDIGRVTPAGVVFRPYRLERENFFGPNFLAVRRTATHITEAVRR